jgi:hypothetical protein
MTATNSAKRIYLPPLSTLPEHSLLLDRRRRRFGRVQIQAIALVIGWFSLLLVALWSEIAVVGAVQRAIKRATFLHSSPPGHDVKPFRW